MIDLSILIPSLHARSDSLARLLDQVARQPAPLLVRCQILVDIDGGEVTIGEKRNRMVEDAVGRYIVFIDDDDEITARYLTEIFIGIDQDVDHVGVGMVYLPENGRPKAVECSMHHGWGETPERYLRPPQHVCAVKRDLALQCPFPHIQFGEDKFYAESVRHLVKSEYLTATPVYHYLHRRNK